MADCRSTCDRMHNDCTEQTNSKRRAHVRVRQAFATFILCAFAIVMLGWLAALYWLARAAFLWLLP